MAITTTRDKLRLTIGDTDTANPLFQDDELDWFLSEEADDIASAALRACYAAMARFARAYDMETDGQAFKRSQMHTAFSEMAAKLEAQGATLTLTAAGSMSTVDVTRVDGFSDDIANQETTATAQTNPRRRYYGDPDRVP